MENGRSYNSAVSLHSHTSHSRESLGFIPRYSRCLPALDYLVRKQMDRYERIHGRPLDFERAWWTPPLTAREAFDLERSSIETTLNCHALVSLSDHDDIEAGIELLAADRRPQPGEPGTDDADVGPPVPGQRQARRPGLELIEPERRRHRRRAGLRASTRPARTSPPASRSRSCRRPPAAARGRRPDGAPGR